MMVNCGQCEFIWMNTLLSDVLDFVRVGMDLLKNITNFVANVIERVRQAV